MRLRSLGAAESVCVLIPRSGRKSGESGSQAVPGPALTTLDLTLAAVSSSLVKSGTAGLNVFRGDT